MTMTTYLFTLGTLDSQRVSAELEVHDDGRLSFSGQIKAPLRREPTSAGQIIMSFREFDARGAYALADIQTDHPAEVAEFFQLWDRWHLNDMRPGCPHQMAEGWDKRPIDPSKPTTAYGRHFSGQTSDSWNLLGWVRQGEHPEGLLGRPCPVCGHKYGTTWEMEPVPAAVRNRLIWLHSVLSGK